MDGPLATLYDNTVIIGTGAGEREAAQIERDTIGIDDKPVCGFQKSC